MGKNYYMVDHTNKRALDVGQWVGLGLECRTGPVTREHLDRVARYGESKTLLTVAKSWLAKRKQSVVLLADRGPWLTTPGWVMDDPWVYAGRRPQGHVMYPPGRRT